MLSDGRSIRDVEYARSIEVVGACIHDEEGRSPSSEASDADFKRFKQLEKELARVRMERDILKKAMAVFSKDLEPYFGSYSSTAPTFLCRVLRVSQERLLQVV